MFARKSDNHESMPEMKWSMLRRWSAWAAFGTLFVGGANGCVDPTDDLNDWLSRTADARSPQPVSDGSGPTTCELSDAGFSNTYLMACLSSLSPNPAEPFLFRTEARFTPAAGGGTFDFTETTLNVGAQSISATAPGAPTVTVNGSAVAADGTSDVHIGMTLIPASADPLGPEVDFSDSHLYFRVCPGDLCANLSGHVTMPIDTPLEPASNICVFRPATPPFPTFQSADFHCP
jgi:hypothetical protein